MEKGYHLLCSNRQGCVLCCNSVLGPFPEWEKKPDTDDAHPSKASVSLEKSEAWDGGEVYFCIKNCPGVEHKINVLST